MSLLDKYTKKYGNISRVNSLRKQEDWMPKTPMSEEKASNIRAAQDYLNTVPEEDKKRYDSIGTIGGMLWNNIQKDNAMRRGQAYTPDDITNYTTAKDIVKAHEYEQKRESVVRGYGKQAYDAMNSYLENKSWADEFGHFSKEGKDYLSKAEKNLSTLKALGIDGDDLKKYQQYIQEYRDIKATEQREKEIRRNVQGSPKGMGTLLTAADVLMSPVSGFIATGEAIKSLGYADKEAPINTYSSLYALSNDERAIEQAVSDQIDSNFGKFLYGAGVSTLKSAEAMAISKGLGNIVGIDAASKLGQMATLPIFGTSAFASTVKEAQDRGFSADKAVMKGLASGMAEMIFEELSLDKAWGTLQNAKLGKGGFKKRLLDIFMGAGIEGSEEIFTSLANHITDQAINGDFSDYQTQVRMNVENGMSLDEATRTAKMDFLTQLVEDGLAGALSGGFMNVGAATVGSINYHNTAKNVNNNAELKKEVYESAKGLDGTTAAEIANSKSVEQITENDMVEIIHSMEEATKRNAHDIAKETLVKMGESEESAEEKANAIVEMSTQENPTEEQEAKNIELVSDEKNAEAYTNVLKSRVAQNTVNDIYENNQVVGKKRKGGVDAYVGDKQIKVYDFADVAKGKVNTSVGVMSLSDAKMDENTGRLFRTAYVYEDTPTSNAYIENYKGQNLSDYSTAAMRAFVVGASGAKFETFLNDASNAYAIEAVNDNAFLQEMYFHGQNMIKAEKQVQISDSEKAKIGETNAQGDLKEVISTIAKAFHVNIEMTDKTNEGSGSLVPSAAKIYLSETESNNVLHTLVHEVSGEYIKAYAPERYTKLVDTAMDFIAQKVGTPKLGYMLNTYRDTYRRFGKEMGNEAEANKTLAEARDELFNDFAAGVLLGSEEARREFSEFVVKRTDLSEEQKKGIFQDLADFIQRIVDAIKNFLSKNKGMNMGTKVAKDLEQYADEMQKLRQEIFNAWDEAREEVIVQLTSKTKDDVTDENLKYSIRTEAAPQKTLKGYKVFVAFKNKPGELYPPMVASPEGLPTPVGLWLNADTGELARDKEGNIITTKGGQGYGKRVQVKQGGKGTKGGSGTLAWRPGWHLGEYPDAKQFAVKDPITGELKALFPENFIFAECEIAADEDYQLEAMEYGISKTGKFNRTYAGLPYIPQNGYYKYRTNPDPQTSPWYITGAMKVIKILDDEDIRKICKKFGVTPLARRGGDINLEEFGFKKGNVTPTKDTSKYAKPVDYSDEIKQLEGYQINGRLDFNDKNVINEFKINNLDASKYEKQYNKKKQAFSVNVEITDKRYDEIKEHFGTTDDIFEAGYLLPDGSMLDFSGRHWGNTESGRRSVDHRDIEEVFSELVDDDDLSRAMNNFIANGNIRLMPESGGIELSKMPTEKQFKTLEKYFDTFLVDYDEEVRVDFVDNKNQTWETKEFDSEYGTDKALRDIRNYYRGGRVSDIMKFHYSLNVDSEGRKLTQDQVKFFKDSKARNSDGNLMVLYHGTEQPGFTVFGNAKNWFTSNRDIAASYSASNNSVLLDNINSVDLLNEKLERTSISVVKKDDKYVVYQKPFFKAENVGEYKRLEDVIARVNELLNEYEEGRVYETYINVENPLEVDVKGGEWDGIEYNGKIYATYELADYARENGYDGLILRNIVDIGPYPEYSEMDSESDIVVAFDSNQVKSIDNKKPTKDKDIRYSVNVDSEGRTLSEDQVKFFAKAKTRDEFGKLKLYYHGTAEGGFTIFDVDRSDGALFFSDKKSVSESYSGSMLYDLNKRMWDENDTTKETEEFRRNNGQVEYWTVMNEEDTHDGDKLIKYATFDSIEEAAEWWCEMQGIPYDIFREETFKQDEKREMFEVYLDVEHPYILDADGAFWNRLYIPEEVNDSTGVVIKFKNFIDLSNIYIDVYGNEEDYMESLGSLAQSVRDFAEMQKEDGYDVDEEAIKKLTELGEEIDEIYNNWDEDEHLDEDGEPIKFTRYIREHKAKKRNTRDVVSWAKKHGYDGVIFKDIIDVGWKNVNGYEVSEVVAVFRSSQVKNTDNLHPTTDVDIRHSLNVDSEGKELTEDQAKFFANSEVVDDYGRLKVMYHGSEAKGFTVFNESEDGIFFTDNEKVARKYSKGKRADYEVYLNITNALKVDCWEHKWDELPLEGDIDDWEESGMESEDGEITTIDYAQYAKEHGYDGVIFYNIIDNPSKSMEISSMVAVAFNPNQIKDVDNLHPTEDEDIRYSLDVEDWEADFFAEMTSEQKEVSKILTEGLKSLDNIEVNKKITDKIAREIKAEYKSRINTKTLSDSLQKIFAYMLDSGSPGYADIVEIMKEVGRPVIEQATEVNQAEKQMYDHLMETLKTYKIRLNDSQKAEVANTFGTYYGYKNALFGKAVFSESGSDLDGLWTEIVDASSGLLDYGTNPADQPMALYEIIEALKPSQTNLYGADQEEAAYDVALSIFRKFLVEQEYENNPKLRAEALKLTEAQQNFKKRLKENYEKRYKEETESLRREREMNMKRLAAEIKSLSEQEADALKGSIEQAFLIRQRNQYEYRLKKLRESKNEETDKKLAELRAKQRNSQTKRIEGRMITQAKARIRKNVETLNSMLAHGTENRHVPINMVRSTIEMLEAIDINTGNSKSLAKYLEKMENIYTGLKDAEAYAFDYDERTRQNIDNLKKLFADRNYTQLSLDELNQVVDITRALIQQIQNANKLMLKKKKADAVEFSREAIREVRQAKHIDNAFMNGLDHYLTPHLNAFREFRKLSGYKDGRLMELYRDLDEGQLKQISVMRDINELFDDVLKNTKEVKNFTSTDEKDLVDSGLKDEKGNPVMITKAQRMSIIMHSYNDRNMEHIIYGGIRVPDLTKKDRKEALARAKIYFYVPPTDIRAAILSGDVERLDLITERATMKVKELEKQLSHWEKEFLAKVKEMFWHKTGGYINETSLKLKGYALARVGKYFPIPTDQNFIKKDIGNLFQDGTLEGKGFLKERKFGRNAIILEDITDTILRQTNDVAKYTGLAIPLRNLNMAWNTTVFTNAVADTLSNAVSNAWGKNNVDYISNLVVDLTSRRDGGDATFLDAMRGRFAGAVLTLNPSVSIKQAASYFTAGAIVGNRVLAKTAKDIGKGFFKKQGIAELEKINPLLWYRNQGNATQELADMKRTGFGKNLPIKVQKALNWVEFMDTGTVRTLEYAAKNYVDANFNLSGAEYWNKVSEVFTQIVEQTQPNYTPLQQADIIRNPNKALKLLVMFKTQPLQNMGVIYDAIGELKTKVKEGADTKEAKQKLIRAITSQVQSAMTFSMMTILANLLLHKFYKYKDDDDKFSWEKVLEEFGAGITKSFWGMLLFGQELVDALQSLLNGEKMNGLNVSFLDNIANLGNACMNLQKQTQKRLDAKTEADRQKYNNGILIYGGKVADYIGQIGGVPVGNLKNMIESLILYGLDVSKGEIGVSEISTKVDSQYDRMYEALLANDRERYMKLFNEMVEVKTSDGKTQAEAEKSVNDSVKSYIKEGYAAGELTYEQAYTILTKDIGMSETDAYYKLDEWLYKSEGNDSYTKYSRMNDAIDEVIGGKVDRTDIKTTISDLMKNGVSAETIRGQITKTYRQQYLELKSKNQASSLKSILLTAYMATGMTEDEANKKIDAWK